MSVCHFIDETVELGSGTKVWHFAVILDHVKIGVDCSIGSHAEIGRWSVIGDRARISHGVFLPGFSKIGNQVFIGPGVIFTDDRYPRANNSGYKAEPPVVENGASIGAGAVILPGVRIGEGALVGAGAIVTKDVHAGTVVKGERARAYLRRVS